jgi:hypothetical protein
LSLLATEGKRTAAVVVKQVNIRRTLSPNRRGSLAEQPYFSFFKYDTSDTFSQVKWMLDHQTFDESQPYQYGVYRW